MLNLPVGTKVICSYRAGHIGQIIGLDPDMVAGASLTEADYCRVAKCTPVRYPFGVMLDSDDSLTPVAEADDEAATMAAYRAVHNEENR